MLGFFKRYNKQRLIAENQDKMDKFLEKYNVPELAKEMETLSIPNIMK